MSVAFDNRGSKQLIHYNTILDQDFGIAVLLNDIVQWIGVHKCTYLNQVH